MKNFNTRTFILFPNQWIDKEIIYKQTTEGVTKKNIHENKSKLTKIKLICIGT